VPSREGGPHTRSSAYKAWRRSCARVGVDNLSLHSTRQTFITIARRQGARKDVLERVTHNAKGDMVDQYTHWDWAPLCEAVGAFRCDAKCDASDSRAKNKWRRWESNPEDGTGIRGNPQETTVRQEDEESSRITEQCPSVDTDCAARHSNAVQELAVEPTRIESGQAYALGVVDCKDEGKQGAASASPAWEALPTMDVVETALAKALAQAAAAGRFDVVAQLARELEARRQARAGNVVRLDTARHKGGA
jgi:hypothetical protein